MKLKNSLNNNLYAIREEQLEALTAVNNKLDILNYNGTEQQQEAAESKKTKLEDSIRKLTQKIEPAPQQYFPSVITELEEIIPQRIERDIALLQDVIDWNTSVLLSINPAHLVTDKVSLKEAEEKCNAASQQLKSKINNAQQKIVVLEKLNHTLAPLFFKVCTEQAITENNLPLLQSLVSHISKAVYTARATVQSLANQQDKLQADRSSLFEDSSITNTSARNDMSFYLTNQAIKLMAYQRKLEDLTLAPLCQLLTEAKDKIKEMKTQQDPVNTLLAKMTQAKTTAQAATPQKENNHGTKTKTSK